MNSSHNLNISILCSVLLIATVHSKTVGNGIDFIGNNLHDTMAGVDVANTTFLISDAVMVDGVLYAFAAFFRSLTPVRFQIWRPLINSTNKDPIYQLISETRVQPSIHGEEVVYMSSKVLPCIRVRVGDRMGIFQESEQGAVSYAFDAKQPSALIYQPDKGTTLNLNDTITFDSLVFPYDISAQAYIHTNLSQYANNSDGVNCECPQILIPDHEKFGPVPAPTPAPGPTGPQGLPGLRGPTGMTGPTGPNGLPGKDGVNGTDGQDGERGPTGAQGDTGVQGKMGATGDMGNTGEQGVKGDKGATGPQGARGPTGPEGKIIYTENGEEFFGAQNQQKYFESKWWHLIFTLWLSIFTLLLLATIISLCCWVKKHNRQHLTSDLGDLEACRNYPATGYPQGDEENDITPNPQKHADDGSEISGYPVMNEPGWNALREGSEIEEPRDSSPTQSALSLTSGQVVVGENRSFNESTEALDMNY